MHGITSKKRLAWRVTSCVHPGSSAQEGAALPTRAKLTLGLLLALGACAAPPVHYSVDGPPGKSDSEIRADADFCNAVLRGMRSRGAFGDLNPTFIQCMANRGDVARRVSSPIQTASSAPTIEGSSACAAGFGDRRGACYRASAPPFHLALGRDYAAANAADKAGNYTDAMRLFREIGAAPEVSVAYANVALPDVYTVPASKRYEELADDYAGLLAGARSMIGRYYWDGKGVPQDYAEAARWYQKAVDTKDIHGDETLFGRAAKRSLGLLYVYGLGVPRDRAKAREIWAGMGAGTPNANDLVRLVDNNALPKTMGEPAIFRQEVTEALAALDAKEARQLRDEEAAEQERIARAPRSSGAASSSSGSARPSASAPNIPGPSISFCNKLTTGSFVSGMLGNPWCD
jgi:Sel1 repeat